MQNKIKVLLFCKDTIWCQVVRKFLELNTDCKTFSIDNDEEYWYFCRYPQEKVDWVISFLSPWILPKDILELGIKGAINFHPGPPEYPGIGGYNFAIYENSKFYGTTCHHMLEKVDSGKIIMDFRFPLCGNETVESLKERSMISLTELFFMIIDMILKDIELPISSHQWSKLRTRKEFQELCRCDLSMSEEELLKRVKACYFPDALDLPYLQLKEKKVFLLFERKD